MSRLPKLEIVASFGVGYDHIDAAWAGQHGVVVTHTPGVLDEDVADIAIALTLAATRRLPQAERYLREGRWPSGAYRLTASLRGRTMGILGLGRIGAAIARRAEAFGLEIAYHGRHKQDGVAYPYYETPIALAEACDILVIAAPGGPATRHIVDSRVLAALGADGVLVNIARGTLVDERALAAALRDGTILAAGLDVYEKEPNVPAELFGARQRRPVAARRLGDPPHALGDGQSGRRQSAVVGRRQRAADADAGNALAALSGV